MHSHAIGRQPDTCPGPAERHGDARMDDADPGPQAATCSCSARPSSRFSIVWPSAATPCSLARPLRPCRSCRAQTHGSAAEIPGVATETEWLRPRGADALEHPPAAVRLARGRRAASKLGCASDAGSTGSITAASSGSSASAAAGEEADHATPPALAHVAAGKASARSRSRLHRKRQLDLVRVRVGMPRSVPPARPR